MPAAVSAAMPEAAPVEHDRVARAWNCRWMEVLQAWSSQLRLHDSSNPLTEDEICDAAWACEQGGRWTEALQLLDAAMSWDLEPRVATHNHVIGACAKAKQWRAALLVLDDMWWTDLIPDAVSYSHAVGATLHDNAVRSIAGKGDRVAELMEEMWNVTGDSSIRSPSLYAAAVELCGHVGQWERALEVLQDMRRDTIPPDTEVYVAAMGACQWNIAIQLFDELRQVHLATNAASYRAAAEACKRDSQPEAVLALLMEMRQSALPPDAVVYEAAIGACEQTARWEWMPQLLKESVQTLLQSFPSLESDAQVQRSKRLTFGEKRDAAAAPAAFASAIAACARSSEWKLALELLDGMAQRGLDPNARAFNGAVWACQRGSQGNQVVHLTEEMQDWRLQPDVMTYHAAMLGHVVNDEWEKASALYKQARNDGACQPWILSGSLINVSSLPAEVSALAMRIFLEEARRKPTGPKRSCEIITSGGDVGKFGKPDLDGFDSPLKRYLHQILLEEVGLKSDPLQPGSIVISKMEVNRWRSDFSNQSKPKKQKRKRAAVDKALDYVWQPSSNG